MNETNKSRRGWRSGTPGSGAHTAAHVGRRAGLGRVVHLVRPAQVEPDGALTGRAPVARRRRTQRVAEVGDEVVIQSPADDEIAGNGEKGRVISLEEEEGEEVAVKVRGYRGQTGYAWPGTGYFDPTHLKLLEKAPKRGQLWRHRGGVYSVVVEVGEERYYEGDIWVKRYVVHRISSYGSFKDKLSDFLDNQKYVGEFDGSQWKYRARQEEVRDVTVSLMNDARVKVEDEEGTSDFHPRLQFFLKNATFVAVGSNAKKRKRERPEDETLKTEGVCPVCQLDIHSNRENVLDDKITIKDDGKVKIGFSTVKVLLCCGAAIHYSCFKQIINGDGEKKCPNCQGPWGYADNNTRDRLETVWLRDPKDVTVTEEEKTVTIQKIVYRCRHLKF